MVGAEAPDPHEQLESPMMRKGLDPPRPDQEMLRVVHIEAVAGNPAVIEDIYALLWQGREDVNQRNYSGFTPLAVAAAAGDEPLAALLLERSADVTLASVDRSEMPIHHAARFGRTGLVTLLLNATLSAGLIDAPNVTGFTPLQLAAAGGHTTIVKQLLRQKASASTRNERLGGATALHAAVLAGAVELSETLLDFDASVEAADQLGRCPLHAAAEVCNRDLVMLILRFKGNAGRRDLGGRTALDLVPQGNPEREQVVTLLSAYARPPPEGRRHDARFEMR